MATNDGVLGHAQAKVAASKPASAAAPKQDQRAFAIAVLQRLGAPTSESNINFLLAWFKREGTRAAYNPLATTLKYGSYTNFNKVGVKNYADWNTGVEATARTLQSSHYKGIVADLKAGNTDAAAHNHANEFKTWSGGGYDHIDYVGGTLGGPIGTGNGGTGPASTYNPSGGGLPPNASPDQIDQYIRENYPGEAGFLDVPEIRTILIKAAQENWTDAKLTAAVQNTKWWRENSESTRAYYNTLYTDPATHEALVQQTIADIKPEFEQLGLHVDIRAIAEAKLKYGWTDAQLRENFVGHLEYAHQHGGIDSGSEISVSTQALMSEAREEYFVPLTQQDVEQWAIDIYSGKKTKEQYDQYLSMLAEARFPGLKEMGVTPGQYMAPIKNTIADILELQPGDVDLLNPKYSTVLQGTDGRPMTISEAQKWARSLPEYDHTKGANDLAASFAETIGQRFGVVAG